MYPEVCDVHLQNDVLESYEEHHVADVLCMELAGMPAGRSSASTPRPQC